MADRPILFSAPMVRALLDGRKTQTRRLLPEAHPRFPHHNQIRMDVLIFDQQRPEVWYWDGVHDRVGASYSIRYAVGDRLWVRESHAIVPRTAYRMSDGVQQTLRPDDNHDAAVYAAEWDRSKPGQWRSSIHMPRWASRLTLIVTDVRVERLQDISREDAIAEGLVQIDHASATAVEMGCNWGFEGDSRHGSPVSAYATLWNHINGPGAWDANPWVAAYTFTVERKNIDEVAL